MKNVHLGVRLCESLIVLFAAVFAPAQTRLGMLSCQDARSPQWTASSKPGPNGCVLPLSPSNTGLVFDITNHSQ
jgi:hypothetical protein